LEKTIRRAKAVGSYDNGVMEVKGYVDSSPRLVYKSPGGDETVYIPVKVDRGISWEQSQVGQPKAKAKIYLLSLPSLNKHVALCRRD
jgi:hypothetical protein